MGFLPPDGGFVVTTSDNNENYRGKRVDEATLKKIIDLLDIPQSAKEKLTPDKIRTIHLFAK